MKDERKNRSDQLWKIWYGNKNKKVLSKEIRKDYKKYREKDIEIKETKTNIKGDINIYYIKIKVL